VGADGSTWGLNGYDEIFQFDGSAFAFFPGMLRRIATGFITTWGLN
jgi:hypothetical protein